MTTQHQRPPQQNPERVDLLLDNRRQLSRREQEVLDLLGEGKTTKEIAAVLKLSTATIGNYRKSICRKWNIHSTAELVYHATLVAKT